MRTSGRRGAGGSGSKHVRQEGGKVGSVVKSKQSEVRSWKRLGMAAGLVLSAFAVAVSLVGLLGAPGEAIEYVLGGLFGVTAWLVVLELGLGAWLVARGRDFSAFRVFGDGVIIVTLAAFTRMAFGRWSGLLGTLFGESARSLFSEPGAFLVGLGLMALVIAERQPVGKRAMRFARSFAQDGVRMLTASSSAALAQVKVQVREIADAELVGEEVMPAVLRAPVRGVTSSRVRTSLKASLGFLGEGALRTALGGAEFRAFAARAALPIVIGTDASGGAMFGDLAAMPHLLVAGASGSGKSVGLGVMLASLLYARSSRDLRLVMIDPKFVELSVFNGIAHLEMPVATEVEEAQVALDWCVTEMNRRFELLAKAGVRNVDSYNAKALDADRMSRIVVVIDEYADLVMSQKKGDKGIETAVIRLGQKARAAGMHVILATQRPSVNVVTGIIKANFSSRMAYRVSSQVDSRTILDEAGAEVLLGKGDCLVRLNGETMRRVQCPFISEDEVNALAASLKPSSRSSTVAGTAEAVMS